MSKYTQFVKYEDLEVNRLNYRHHEAKDENEAIKLIIDEDIKEYEKLLIRMASDLQTITFILLVDENGEIRVMDGNRRLSIFRIHTDHSLIPSGSIYANIREICISSKLEHPEHVVADIYYSEDETDVTKLEKRLEELHIQSDDAKVQWNALSQYRFSKMARKSREPKHPWIKTLIAYDYSDDEIVELTDNRTDVFNRFFRISYLNIQEDGHIDMEFDRQIIHELVNVIYDGSYQFNSRDEVKIDTRTTTEDVQLVIKEIIEFVHLQQVSQKEETGSSSSVNDGSKDDEDIPVDDKSKDPEKPADNEPQDTPVNPNTKNRQKRLRRKPEPEKFLLKNLFISEKSRIDGSYHIGIQNVLDELKRLGERDKYKQFHLSTYFLVRALIELCLKFYLFTYHNSTYNDCLSGRDRIDANLGKMIEKSLKQINSGNKDFFVDEETTELFRIFFENSATADQLNNMVHHPDLLTGSIQDLQGYAHGPLFLFLSKILTTED